jgi:hypothetical protein
MTVLVTMDLPVTRADVDAVAVELAVNDNPPDGLIVHLATEFDGGVHIVDVWESAEQHERFAAEHLGPAVAKVAAERGIPVAGPPAFTITEAFDLVRGR